MGGKKALTLIKFILFSGFSRCTYILALIKSIESLSRSTHHIATTLIYRGKTEIAKWFFKTTSGNNEGKKKKNDEERKRKKKQEITLHLPFDHLDYNLNDTLYEHIS